MSSIASQRQNLGVGELIADKLTTVLELSLPFLCMEDLFPSVCSVSKEVRDQCLPLLRQHCQKTHPALLFLLDRNNANNNTNNQLTYGEIRRFLLSEQESRPPTAVDLDSLSDYEMVLEITTTEDVKLICSDIQLLECGDDRFFLDSGRLRIGCDFGSKNFPRKRTCEVMAQLPFEFES